MNDKLVVGSHVKVTLNSGETIEGKVKSRSGIGENDNFSPGHEEVVLQKDNGDEILIRYSRVRHVE